MNWFNRFFTRPDVSSSILHDERTFYQAFIRDLKRSKRDVIIECPFITSSRMEMLLPLFEDLLRKNVKIHIVTRDPAEHDEFYRHQATNEILMCAELGIRCTLVKSNFHRKLAIIDRTVIWEGSLNILSQARSKEIMRRIVSGMLARELLQFLR